MIKKKIGSIYSIIKLALKGDDPNILSGSIDRAIILLAIPMMLEMLMESLFAIVDIFFVSRVGVNAVAVVGLTESLLSIIYSIAFGLAMGTTAMVARRVGEKDYEGAAVAGVQAIYIALFLSLLIGLVGYIYSEDLLRLMGASEEIINEGGGFTKIILTSNAVIMLLFLNNAIFRGAGDAALAMRALWLANGINMLLDPFLIFGIGPFPEMGVQGGSRCHPYRKINRCSLPGISSIQRERTN